MPPVRPLTLALGLVAALPLAVGLAACDAAPTTAPHASLVAPLEGGALDLQFGPSPRQADRRLETTVETAALEATLRNEEGPGAHALTAGVARGGAVTTLSAVSADGQTMAFDVADCKADCPVGTVGAESTSVHITLYCEGTRCNTIVRHDFTESGEDGLTTWLPPGAESAVSVREAGVVVEHARGAGPEGAGVVAVRGTADLHRARALVPGAEF